MKTKTAEITPPCLLLKQLNSTGSPVIQSVTGTIKEISNLTEQMLDKDGYLYLNSLLPLPEKLSIVESPQKIKKTICKDKSSICPKNSPNMKLFLILDPESIGNDKDLKPFWNPSKMEMSKRLSLPIEIDSADSHSNSYSYGWNSIKSDSWFSIRETCPVKKNCPKTFSQFSKSMLPEITENEDTSIKKVPLTQKEKEKKVENAKASFKKRLKNLSNPCPETVKKMESKLNNYIETINNMEYDKNKYSKLETKKRRENKLQRCLQVRLKVNSTQKSIFKKWFGCSRYTYNWVLDKWNNKEETSENFNELRDKYISKASIPKNKDWLLKTPKEIRSEALRDLIKAKNNIILKEKKHGGKNTLKFKSKKELRESILIPKSAIKIKDKGINIYENILKETFRVNKKDFHKLKSIKNFIDGDCRLKYHKPNYYVLHIPYLKDKTSTENQNRGVVSLDPGVRTMLTGYELNGKCVKIGESATNRLIKLAKHYDNLKSKIDSKDIRCRKRLRLIKGLRRLLWRIKNKKEDFHNKIINYLCKNYSVILLPTFKVSDLFKKKLKSKAARQLANLGFYNFSEKLKHKCEEKRTTLIRCNESFTTRTCSNCGEQKDVKNSKKYICNSCNVKLDRDVNGARNIMLRAMVATPLHVKENNIKKRNLVNKNNLKFLCNKSA